MFSIRWISHCDEKNDSMAEKSLLPNADAVVASCLERLPLMQERSLVSPPDGFIVLDGEGQEVRRWLASARPAITVREAARTVMVLVRNRGKTLAMTAGIEEFRDKFPDLDVSDTEIIEALSNEVRALQALDWNSTSESPPLRSPLSAGATRAMPSSRG